MGRIRRFCANGLGGLALSAFRFRFAGGGRLTDWLALAGHFTGGTFRRACLPGLARALPQAMARGSCIGGWLRQLPSVLGQGRAPSNSRRSPAAHFGQTVTAGQFLKRASTRATPLPCAPRRLRNRPGPRPAAAQLHREWPDGRTGRRVAQRVGKVRVGCPTKQASKGTNRSL